MSAGVPFVLKIPLEELEELLVVVVGDEVKAAVADTVDDEGEAGPKAIAGGGRRDGEMSNQGDL